MEGFSTVLQADSIETFAEDLFVCGTYSLRSDDATGRRWREGLIHLASCDDAGGPRQSVACGGVLDLKWQKRGGPLLASVESEGGMGLFRLREGRLEDEQRGKLDRQSRTLRSTGSESLINLSVDWMHDGSGLAVSHDDGSLSVWRVAPEGLRNVKWWHGHDNEAWIVACHRSEASVLWSGADDGLLRGWDLRSGVGKRRHVFEVRSETGVTSIQASPHSDGLWAVGGYDETLRLFDERNTAAPVAQLEGLGGGVWRAKWHPEDPRQLALACMRGGFRIVRHEDGGLATAFHYTRHESEALAYGIDWIAKRNRVACCSFYDAQCSLFSWPK